MTEKIKRIILLESSFFIYSISALFIKMATQNNPTVFKIIALYGLGLVMLAIYALIWQQILKKMPLSVAFANKGTVIIWGMILGKIFFNERISIGQILGATIIIIGIIIMMTGENKK